MDTKIVSAAKWSVITEVLAKMITPITNIILAHMLAPDAFGILATVLMVISFAEMLADAGFQKYLVQHEFMGDAEKKRSISVAFSYNMLLACILWACIVIWRDDLAILVGNPGLGLPLAVMGLMLPFSAFSSIQTAMYRREFDFRFLMKIRLITIGTPLAVSIPMAYMGFEYWALIMGLLCAQLFTGTALFLAKRHDVRFDFSFNVFRRMFGFSAWSLAEAFSIWLTAWVDTFIISHMMDPYYLGLYKMPTAVVTTVMGIATSSMAPVLFAALSRKQNDDVAFGDTFFTVQRYMAFFLIPLGIGMFVYRDSIVQLILGPQWKPAAIVLGAWALSSAVITVTANLISEVFRAKGLPNLSFVTQIGHLVVLIPVIYVSAQYDFTVFVYARSAVRLELLAVALVLLKLCTSMNAWAVLSNVSRYFVAAVFVGVASVWFDGLYEGLGWTTVSILFSAITYGGIMSLFPRDREFMLQMAKQIKHKIIRG